ncbi:multivesicular body subunit 12A [Drosophila obscura]|uniref:multivesicular body subunit 12A n=1 Tax=Drosophila obscura TaxID=7282 RepID=UPI001BB15D90|nr:multivesicular body subunit 12A [Drosophila obscura]XP_022220034.2 multivesicular body subunit 12A [Drosophila obscura]
MNKVGKHIQSGISSLGGGSPVALSTATLLGSPIDGETGVAGPGAGNATNVFNSIMSFLPDNRPITSLHIVEDFERCPKNFSAINRTYDQDADADLWRDYSIFARQNTRYLCLSKSEGLPDYVVETLQVIADKTTPPKEFSLLSRTADSDQKAWRKRQIAYKLSKRGTVTQAVTDIILCSKLKVAPDGFKLAGDINGVLICYKTGTIPVRLPPPVPPVAGSSGAFEVEQALNRLNLQGQRHSRGPLPQPPTEHHDYEEIQANYQISSPQRPAPPRPAGPSAVGGGRATYGGTGTLGTYTELEGVPFVMDVRLQRSQPGTDLPILPELTTLLRSLDYDFQLERQVLCTMKSSASKNPFFK